MKPRNYHLYLTEDEKASVLKSLIELKNSLIKQGKYTDAVDEVIIKFIKAKKKNQTIKTT